MLPLENISGDPEQEYFEEGMVEEIITADIYAMFGDGVFELSDLQFIRPGQAGEKLSKSCLVMLTM